MVPEFREYVPRGRLGALLNPFSMDSDMSIQR